MNKNYFFNLCKISQNKCFKNLIYGVSFLSLGTCLTQAQVSGYSFAQNSGTYTPIIAGTILETASSTSGAGSLYNVSYSLPLPFNFNFNGINYTDIKVSSHGYITFGGTDSPTAANPISSTSNYEGIASAWGRSTNSFNNIAGVTGDIRWETVGTAPNRELVIQWNNFRPNYTTSTTLVYAFSFQMRLKETSNQISVVYNSGSYLVGTTAITGSAQIGLRGANNTDFNNRLNASTDAFTGSTTGTANNSTQAYNSSVTPPGMAPAGFTYTWTPPSCFAPVINAQNSSSTATSVTLNWSTPSPAPSSYEIYYSTSSTPPTASTVPTNTNITSTSYTVTPLSSNTAYYFWVRSNCGSGNVSSWSLVSLPKSTNCVGPSLLSTTGGTTSCANNTATLSATAPTGAVIKWYDANTGGNLVGTGNSFTTPALTATTNYWASAATVETATNVGPANPAALGSNLNTSTAWNLLFTVNSSLTLNSVDVFSGVSGQAGNIEILDEVGNIISSTPFVTTGAGTSTPQTVVLNKYLTVGNYAIRRSGAANLYRNGAGATFPYTTPQLVITGTTFTGYPAYYFYFYNLNFTPTCESERTSVTATLDTSCLEVSESALKNPIQVYPNPFRDAININRPELVSKIIVSDMSGKFIKTIPNPNGNIRLESLPNGIYLLLLEMKDGSRQSMKIIKK